MTADHNEPLHRSALLTAVLCAAIYDGLRTSAAAAARPFFFWMLINAAISVLGIKLLRMLSKPFTRVIAFAAWLALVFGIVQTMLLALSLWNQFYPGSAGWLLLSFALFVVWHPSTHAINSTGWILRWCVWIVFLLLAIGVWSQLRWQRLSFTLSFSAADLTLLRFRPEYFVTPFMLQTASKQHDVVLPLADCAIRFLLLFFTELVFGNTLAQQLEHGELLRAWGMGIFSRIDSLVMIVWLMTALYRVMLLLYLMHWMRSICLGKELQSCER